MKWFYLDGQKTVGPLAGFAMMELHGCGMISNETQVREESGGDWVRFDQAFDNSVPSNPSAPTAITGEVIKFHCSKCQQKISAESDQAGQSVQCPACDAELTIPLPAPYIEEKPKPDIPKVPSSGEPASVRTGPPNKNNHPETTQELTAQDKLPKTIYVIKDIDQLGPYSIGEIAGKVEAGEFSVDNLYWEQGMSNWESIAKALNPGSTSKLTPPPPPPNQRSIPTGASVAGQPAHPVTSSAPNRRPIKWIPALVTFCLMAAFWCLSDLAILEDGNSEDGLIYLLAGLPVAILAVAFLSLLHYKCWNSLPPQFRATTPAKAVGFMFIPFYNFYWGFTSWPKLSEGLMNWQRSAGLNPTNTKGLGITFAILFICHCIIELISAPALGVMIKIAIVVIFILYYLKLVRGFNQMLNDSPSVPDPLLSGFWNFKKTAITIAVALPIYWVIMGMTYAQIKRDRSSSSEERSSEMRLPGWYIAVQNMCKVCEGKGVVEQSCGTCRSRGTITTRTGYVTACPTCGGTGTVAPTCRSCGGSGKINR